MSSFTWNPEKGLLIEFIDKTPRKMAMAFQAHARSISLPCRLHRGSLRVEERLNKLKALDESPCSFASIKARVVGLGELYLSLTELIQSPSTQQPLSQYEQGRVVEDALASSVAFIDACSASRDMVSSLKEHTRDLQSALRRKSSVRGTHAAAYAAFRKKSKKEISKCIGELKQAESKSNAFAPLLDADLHLAMIVRVLREVVSVAISVFQRLLVFLSAPQLTSPKWALISRLVATGEERILNEIGGVDVAILSLQSRRNGATDFEALQRRLTVLDSGSQDLETALHALLRCLLQNRVALLNILTTHCMRTKYYIYI